MKYSTPSMYIDAIAAQDIAWPTKYDDLFPYADHEAAYWTGYFTSMANDKKYIRDSGHTLNSSNKLFALAALDQSTSDSMITVMEETKDYMMDVVGITQHHDAITGTAKFHVADDYARRVSDGI